jgi:lipoyl(octanoyl) transferase
VSRTDVTTASGGTAGYGTPTAGTGGTYGTPTAGTGGTYGTPTAGTGGTPTATAGDAAPGSAVPDSPTPGNMGYDGTAPVSAARDGAGEGVRPVPIRAGLVDYLTAWDEQRRLHEAVVAGTHPDTVLLLEHPSVYTAGKRTEPWDRPMDGTPVIDVDRGGKITWHGPGQLVGYPIIKLPAVTLPGATIEQPVDVVAFVRRTEQLLIDVCAELGVTATRIEGRSGAWVPADERGPDRKIAAIGIRVARRVTQHGFSINCDCDLTAFDRIVPCGIRDAGVTSLSAELGRPVTVAEVLPIVERRLPTLLG